MWINNYEVKINRKNVKNINLRVYPDLSIKISAPKEMKRSEIEKMMIEKEDWINKQLQKYEQQKRIPKRNYISGEDHYFNGKRYILRVHDSITPCIKISKIKTIDMYVKENTSIENKTKLMDNFYRRNLKKKLDEYVPKWEKILKVKAKDYHIRKMKNRWGSCNTNNKTILFNLELAKKKDSEIQYVVIYELLQLIEKKHNAHFKQLITKYCPKWKIYQETLNQIL